jgi:hypothetical protein
VTLRISLPGGQWLQDKGRGTPTRSSKSAGRYGMMWGAARGKRVTDVASLMSKCTGGKKSVQIVTEPGLRFSDQEQY